MTRAHITLKTKLAATLCQMMKYVGDGEWQKIISHDEAKTLSEDQILARFDWHHYPIPKAHDGPDVHWNIEPIEHAPHDEITAKIDIPRIAKVKRIQARENGTRRPRQKIPSRPFQKRA